MPPKRKKTAAKNKNEALPAKTIKGEKKIESEKTPTVSPDPGATGGTATSDRKGKGKCAYYACDFYERESLPVKELPCRHYCHSLCVVLFYEIEWEEVHCSCGYGIPSNWLKKTVDEIKEQLRRDELRRDEIEIECLVCTALVTKEDPSD